MKVCMIITNGFEEAETLCPFDMMVRGGIEVDMYSLIDQDVKGRSGATLTNLLPFSAFDSKSYDALVLPGGPEWKEIEASPKVQAIIQEFSQANKYIGAICAAPTILGRAGLLKGKHYTCFESMNDDFGGVFHKDYVVRDDKLITACSAAASIDFGLALVEVLVGKEIADQVKASIYYDYK